MPRVDLKLAVDIARTARVMQLEGMFDVPEKKTAGVEFHFDVPIESRPWQIGLIVGPSGAGKSSVARHLFGDSMIDGYDWPSDRSVVDGFGQLPIAEIVGALSSVGFASPPSWLKPFRVLSNGERFRATLARAIVDPRPLVVIDEFSSVVDRQVAQIGSHATAKAVRARPGKQFVAVTCHDDVLNWLQPDWVLEPHVGLFTWRSLQRRPSVDLEIVRADSAAWRWFAPHHYLSAELHRGARCFVGMVDGRPAAFGALLHMPHAIVRDIQRLHRLVVLPDFQGLGLGAHAFTGQLGALCRSLGFRMSVTTSHPTLIRAWAKSPRWRMTVAPALGRAQGKTSSLTGLGAHTATKRRVASFQYAGSALAPELKTIARRLWA